MNSLIQSRIGAVIEFQFVVLLLVLSLAAWGFYLVWLKDLSKSRHKIFAQLFRDLQVNLVLGILGYASYHALRTLLPQTEAIEITAGYVGLLTIILAAKIFIKITQIVANEYFFFQSKKAGVPVLLVNIASFILYLIILGWMLAYLFDVRVTSLIATSAVLTIVLGLALQDTLGNLFAAISLQIDKPFAMDDWIELHNGSDKIAGRVVELSWRATLLQAITDEMITIPNRSIAQWQIVNFSAKAQPFLRGQLFRIPLTADIPAAKRALMESIRATPGMVLEPEPLVFVTETTSSWITLKAIYACTDYGNQYVLADRFFDVALEHLRKSGITLAQERLVVEKFV